MFSLFFICVSIRENGKGKNLFVISEMYSKWHKTSRIGYFEWKFVWAAQNSFFGSGWVGRGVHGQTYRQQRENMSRTLQRQRVTKRLEDVLKLMELLGLSLGFAKKGLFSFRRPFSFLNNLSVLFGGSEVMFSKQKSWILCLDYSQVNMCTFKIPDCRILHFNWMFSPCIYRCHVWKGKCCLLG